MASLKYFLLRAVLFVVPFAVFLVLGIGVILSAVYAVLIAFALNFLFLTRQRNAAASEVRDVFGGRKQVRTKREVADAEVEDAIDDAQRAEEDAEYGDEGASEEGLVEEHAKPDAADDTRAVRQEAVAEDDDGVVRREAVAGDDDGVVRREAVAEDDALRRKAQGPREDGPTS